MTDTRICNVCGKAKGLKDFPVDRKGPDGRAYRCKTCMSEHANRHYRHRRESQGAEYCPLLRDEEWQEIEARGWMYCRACKQKRPLTEFRFSLHPPRRRRKCRSCDRRRSAELNVLHRAQREAYSKRYRCKQYGITPEDYDRMLAEQNALCAICRRPLGPRLQTIDHCHVSGKVRGIVHASCNLMIGNAGEDIEVLRGAIAYLTVHASRPNSSATDTTLNGTA